MKIAFGTDSAVSPHGKNAEAFGLLVAHGLTPAAALRAGTLSAATLLNLEKTVGTIEVGKQADLVAVPGDVLADVKAKAAADARDEGRKGLSERRGPR